MTAFRGKGDDENKGLSTFHRRAECVISRKKKKKSTGSVVHPSWMGQILPQTSLVEQSPLWAPFEFASGYGIHDKVGRDLLLDTWPFRFSWRSDIRLVPPNFRLTPDPNTNLPLPPPHTHSPLQSAQRCTAVW